MPEFIQPYLWHGEIWDGYVWPTVWVFIQIMIVIGVVMVAMPYLTFVERKVIGAMQLRRGPNVVGPFGLFQPIADGLKLFVKEMVIPTRASVGVFLIAPCLTFMLALVGWAVIPFDDGWVIADINVGILYLFAVSSLGVYGILMGGWAGNSKYSFLGGLRSAAQMVSYEVSMGFIIVTVILIAGSMNLSDIVRAQKDIWFVVPLLPMAAMFFVSTLAETNRHPFDLPEAEAELVAGFNVEYGGMAFGLFYLGEYINMILMSAMTSILFLGGWLPPIDVAPLNWIPGVIWLALKISFCLFVFIWVRATLPRFRYDQLMRLGWKVFLPVSLAAVVVVSGVLVAFDLAPAAR